MAETYHVFNWRELPLRTAAVLASGLPEDSRCFRRLNGQKLTAEQILQFAMLDELRLLVWMQTKDAGKGRHRPESLLQKVMDGKPKTKVRGFRTAEDFEAQRKKIVKGI